MDVITDSLPLIIAITYGLLLSGLVWLVRTAVKVMVQETNGDPNTIKALLKENLEATKATHKAVKDHSEWSQSSEREFNRRGSR